ncbi:helix-turn-helix domain-containing protein [Paenibacillus aurantiacus]|uniref:Helix-turn-helix domain-containing protein n=1 Tax=Paenibacillus aurantiacus TaxID=1936118 RepID=A0ABV5KUT0_9BACL
MTRLKVDTVKRKLEPLLSSNSPMNVTFTPEEIRAVYQILFERDDEQGNDANQDNFVVSGSPIDLPQLKQQEEREYFTVEEAAAHFRISKQAIYKWIHSGKIEFERTLEDSRDIRIPKAQFKNVGSATAEFRKRGRAILGTDRLELSNPSDVFRSEEGDT